jgi:hypothetical protein
MADEELKHRERENIVAALKRSGGRIYGAGGAAELHGIRPTRWVRASRSSGSRSSPDKDNRKKPAAGVS